MGSEILEYLLAECIKVRNARGPTGFGREYPSESAFIGETLPAIVSRFGLNGFNYPGLAAALQVFYGVFTDYSWAYSRQHSFMPIGDGDRKELFRLLSGKGGKVF